jgi:rare lipoprotein A
MREITILWSMPMRTTLLTVAILVTVNTTANAGLVASQSMMAPFDVSLLASSTLNLDSQVTTANSIALATPPQIVPQSNTDSLVSSDVSDSKGTDAVLPSNPTSKVSVLDRLSSVATDTVRKFKQTGIASWYGHQFNGRKTANGERFDMNAMTAAHRSLPLPCFIRVTNKENGKSVIVKVNDRGPYAGNRILDLSYGAAKKLGIVDKGMGNVTIERVVQPN